MDDATRVRVIDIERRVARNFPDLFDSGGPPYNANTHQRCSEFLYAFCAGVEFEIPELRMGLLTKNSAENGFTWPNGIRTSHDTVALPNGERFDSISAAGDNRFKPTATFGVIPPEHWRPHNVWINYKNVEAGGNPNPNPPVGDGLAKAFRQIDENNRFLRQVAGIWNLPFPD